MFYIACTRFTNATYKENIEYRETHNEQVIYGSAFKIRDIYPIGCLIFVAEMNNETNKIEGIGLIKNSLVSDKRYKIYENSDNDKKMEIIRVGAEIDYLLTISNKGREPIFIENLLCQILI